MVSDRQNVGLIKALGIVGLFISLIGLGILMWYGTTYKMPLTKIIIPSATYVIVLIITFVGIFSLRNWARILLIIISLIKLSDSTIRAIKYFTNDISQLKLLHICEQSTNVIIYTLLILFLCKKSIRKQFTAKRKIG